MELNSLLDLMKTYDKKLKTERNVVFMRDFFDINKSSCMPLTRDETFIFRCVTGVIPNISKNDLAECFGIKVSSLNKRINAIEGILRLYFYSVQQKKNRYNKTVTSLNENITIFGLGISNKGLYDLRLLSCYFLKDITTAREETLKELLSSQDYSKVMKALDDNGMKLDSRVYKTKKLK